MHTHRPILRRRSHFVLFTAFIMYASVLTGALSACITPPDLECSEFNDDPELQCPAGQECSEFKCLDICTFSEECSNSEACIDTLCRQYSSTCGADETCVEGYGCDPIAGVCIKLIGGCHPAVPNICHTNAACLPSENGGGNSCACNTGFVGDGFQCDDVDECAGELDDCTKSASCTNTPGGYTCACGPGSLPEGNGRSCLGGWIMGNGGQHFSCAIRIDGTLWCMGDNEFGQLGVGDEQAHAVPTQVGSATDWIEVSASSTHACGVRGEGLYCWGDNGAGQLGIEARATTTPKRVAADKLWRTVTTGAEFSCAITLSNELYCWGSNTFLQLGGAGPGGSALQAVQVTGVSAWKDVYAGDTHACARTTANALFCWGNNTDGRVGVGTRSASEPPTIIDAVDTWQEISLGSAHSCGLKSNKLWCWGSDLLGQTSLGDRLAPMQVGISDSWTGLSAQGKNTCAIQGVSNSLLCWGANDEGQLGRGTQGKSGGVLAVAPPEGASGWISVFSGGQHACGITQGSAGLFCWGDSKKGQLGDGASGLLLTAIEPGAEQETALPTFSFVAAGLKHSCAIAEGGASLYCWGGGELGQLGVLRSAQPSYAPLGPIAPANDKSITWQGVGNSPTDDTVLGKISAGNAHSCAISASGALFCWGSNSAGQLGLGSGLSAAGVDSPTEVALPVDPTGLVSWVMVTAASEHTCAIASKGTAAGGALFCWGANGTGQLGLGNTTPQNTPARVGIMQWQSVSAGAAHVCGVQTNGDLFCWGDNASRQAGRESMSPSPVSLSTGGWLRTAVSARYSCGIRNGGELWCWGKRASRSAVSAPKRLGSGDDWRSITVGGRRTTLSFACGLRREGTGPAGTGTMYCWGNSSAGQGARGSTAESPLPVQVAIARGGPQTTSIWRSLSAGGDHVCAINNGDGRVYCAGDNSAGQSGHALRLSPVEVRAP